MRNALCGDGSGGYGSRDIHILMTSTERIPTTVEGAAMPSSPLLLVRHPPLIDLFGWKGSG